MNKVITSILAVALLMSLTGCNKGQTPAIESKQPPVESSTNVQPSESTEPTEPNTSEPSTSEPTEPIESDAPSSSEPAFEVDKDSYDIVINGNRIRMKSNMTELDSMGFKIEKEDEAETILAPHKYTTAQLLFDGHIRFSVTVLNEGETDIPIKEGTVIGVRIENTQSNMPIEFRAVNGLGFGASEEEIELVLGEPTTKYEGSQDEKMTSYTYDGETPTIRIKIVHIEGRGLYSFDSLVLD